MPTFNLKPLFLFSWLMFFLFSFDVWGGKQGQENPDLPRSIILRTRVVKNYILDNKAKAQIKRYDGGYETAYKANPIYEFERFSSKTSFSSISFIYEENGLFQENGEDRIFYGKMCGKGELLLPDSNIIYTKPYLYLENDIITECLNVLDDEHLYYIFPFGISVKWKELIRFYYPYGGMVKNSNDIKGAEQTYFFLERDYNKETSILRAFHSDLASEGIDCLSMGKQGWIKLSSRDHESHRSVFDIPEEHGLSAGAALCGGYAKFEYVQQTPEGPLKQIYKSFRYNHPGNHPDLVDILFVQDLEHDCLPQVMDKPLQIDPSIQCLNDYLLNKLEEAFQEKIQFKQDFTESNDQNHIAKTLSPCWEEIQNCLVATAKFIDQHPLLADITINGLQFIMGGPLKFAITKIADYLAGDLIANSKEKAQQFLAEQLGVPVEHMELATAAIGMGVDLCLSRPANVLKSAKKVIEAAKKGSGKKSLKRRYSLNALPSLDLAHRSGAPSKSLIPSLDLAGAREVKKNLVHVERKIHNNSLKLGRQKKAAVKPYEVGEYSEMIKRSKTDKLDIHHAPQKHAAKQIIPDYNESTGPSIAVPEHLHRKIKNTKGIYDDNPRQLLAKTAQDLRNHTDAPNSAIQELLKKTKSDFPGIFDK